MVEIKDIVELIDILCKDRSIPRNVRTSLEEIKEVLEDNNKEIAVKIDSALQKVESLSLDPNLSADARMQIWRLTSLLEA